MVTVDQMECLSQEAIAKRHAIVNETHDLLLTQRRACGHPALEDHLECVGLGLDHTNSVGNPLVVAGDLAGDALLDLIECRPGEGVVRGGEGRGGERW